MTIKAHPYALAATIALATSLPEAAHAGSLVDLQFCNKFGQALYVAIAYPQTTGHWVSRGWMMVSNGECDLFDTALHVPIFYVRAQTNWYRVGRGRRGRETWGGKSSEDQRFAVVENSGGSFNYYQAETKFAGVPNEPFFKFLAGSQITLDGNSTATVTFNADGTTTSEIAPVNPPASSPPSGGDGPTPPKHTQ